MRQASSDPSPTGPSPSILKLVIGLPLVILAVQAYFSLREFDVLISQLDTTVNYEPLPILPMIITMGIAILLTVIINQVLWVDTNETNQD